MLANFDTDMFWIAH